MDPFGNKRVDVLLENFVARPATVVDAPPGTPPLPELPLLYFGIPANDQLEQYWTTVEGRLFQIRHCMNLAGQVRQLPPFAHRSTRRYWCARSRPASTWTASWPLRGRRQPVPLPHAGG
ncbi:hypothetical protein BZL30_0875 [Mycobacterium kansasii]|uniref:Uncharacterized protein n=1 Tax=Mycobacterium kansasii TaxID=1768 RepID=A0A1V3XQL7_MYCKA|nr:hypothetical protein BZL30_0875 [Mycobacterium kansasii]